MPIFIDLRDAEIDDETELRIFGKTKAKDAVKLLTLTHINVQTAKADIVLVLDFELDGVVSSRVRAVSHESWRAASVVASW